MGKEEDKRNKDNLFNIAASITLFILAGPVLVIVNKKILRDNGLHLPAFVSAMGIIFTSIFTRICVATGRVVVKSNEFGLRKLLPVGITSAGTFMFGNMSYMYLDAGFIQMLKAGTPAVLLIMLVGFKVEKISRQASGWVVLMILGGLVAAGTSPTFNTTGLFVMFLSELCEGGRCVLTQLFLQKMNFSVWDAGYHMAPITAVCCLVLSACTEWPRILQEEKLPVFYSQLPLLFVSGCVGIAVNFASFLVIKLTSSLLTKLLVAARNAGLVLFFILCGEPWTSIQAVGYFITLVAFTGYSVVKVLEAQKPKPVVEVELADKEEV